MGKKAIGFDAVREIGLAMSGVREEEYFGKPALKIGKEMMVCLPSNPSAEAGSLLVQMSLEERAELLAANPDAYYVTPHYVGFTGVLVRFARVDKDALRDL